MASGQAVTSLKPLSTLNTLGVVVAYINIVQTRIDEVVSALAVFEGF